VSRAVEDRLDDVHPRRARPVSHVAGDAVAEENCVPAPRRSRSRGDREQNRAASLRGFGGMTGTARARNSAGLRARRPLVSWAGRTGAIMSGLSGTANNGVIAPGCG